MKVLLLLTFVGSLSLCQAYSNGPPPGACATMTPGHRDNTAQTSPAPYSINADSNIYRRGQDVIVTISATSPSTTPFKGFFIQARREGSTQPIGSFNLGSETEVQLLNCLGGTNNGVAHNSPVNKTRKQFIWNNEAGYDVYFQGTFVHNFATFWTNVRSEIVRENTTGLSTTTMRTTMSTMRTTTSDGPTMTCNFLVGLVLVLACRLFA